MTMNMTVQKITVSDHEFGMLVKPDTSAVEWAKISETETTMTIEVPD